MVPPGGCRNIFGEQVGTFYSDAIGEKHQHFTWHQPTCLAFCMLYEFWSFSPRHVPYQCNDPSISKVYKGDTITFGQVITAVIIGPLITLAILEFYSGKLNSKRWKSIAADYSLGLLYTATITEIGKASVAELRPHFLDSCRPNVNCSSGLVTEYECTGAMAAWLSRDIYKSFPSGHASVSVYACAFFAIYCQTKEVKAIAQKIVPIFIQSVYFILASVCSISRITDHRHHWWDVLSGASLGTICAFLTYQLLVLRSKKIELKDPKKDDDIDIKEE